MSSADQNQQFDPKLKPWLRWFMLVLVLVVLVLIARVVTLPVERPPAGFAPPAGMLLTVRS